MNILIVDDHAIVRAGLSRLLRAELGAEVREAATGREAVGEARGQTPDLVILDLNLPELGGLELLARLRQASPAPILVLTMHAETEIVARTLAAGAQGYVSKSAAPEELLSAVRKVAAGGRYVEADLAQALALAPPAPDTALTAREQEILRLLGAGSSLSEIAAALGLGYKTVANACTALKLKLGLRRTADLIRHALQ